MWAVCNNCGSDAQDLPCIIWVPRDDLTGLTGCPYHVHGEENPDLYPACWVALKKKDVEDYIEKVCTDDSDYSDPDGEHAVREKYKTMLKECTED